MSRPPAQKDVGRTFARDGLGAFIAQSAHVDALQEMLPRTEQDGWDGEMQLVDQGRAPILPNGGHATAEANVAAACCGARLLQGTATAFADNPTLPASRP